MEDSTVWKLYHTSELALKKPDVHYGRRNADFGGGFYLSDSLEFATKWANSRKPMVNEYSLDLSGLNVKRFALDKEWFAYISANRAGYPDALSEADVIIGPVANDTLYDTYGIITSGLINSEDALKLLAVGERYFQLNIKTERAAAQLQWNSVKTLSQEEIAASKEAVKEEEKVFREAFWAALRELDNFREIEDMLT